MKLRRSLKIDLFPRFQEEICITSRKSCLYSKVILLIARGGFISKTKIMFLHEEQIPVQLNCSRERQKHRRSHLPVHTTELL